MAFDVRLLSSFLALSLACGGYPLPAPLVAKPEFAGVRLLVPKKARGAWVQGCEFKAADAAATAASLLSQAGFSITMNPGSKHDAVVDVHVTVKRLTEGEIEQLSGGSGYEEAKANPCYVAFGSIGIEPGAVESFTSDPYRHDSSGPMTEAVRRLQAAPQLRAFVRASPEGTPSEAPQKEAMTTSATSGGALTFATGSRSSDAYALVVGIEEYRDVPAPAGATADAKMFRDLAQVTLGVPEANLRALFNGRATKSDIERELGWLTNNVPEGGKIYFFFAGHGAPSVDGKAFLLPYDANADAIDRSGLHLDTVLSELSASKAREIVAFTDACFSGAGGRSLLPKGARPLLRITEPSVPSRVVLYAAAQADQISGSAPDAATGLFTVILSRGLGEAQADLDGDGAITLDELERWTTPRVEREAKRQSRDQRPSLALPAGTSAESVVLARGLPSR